MGPLNTISPDEAFILAKQSSKRRYWLAGDRDPAQDTFFIEALDSEIWEEGDSKSWDSCWYTGMPDEIVFEHLTPSKSINHIPGNNGLTIKDFLHDTLASSRDRLGSWQRKARMDYFPHVYSMPNEYHDWLQHAHDDPDHKWILKPKNSSRGRGIEVVRDLADVPLDPKFMVQDYLDNPHLINERKYVLRLYVLIASVEPLRVYLYDEGFAKLASDPYDINDLDNPFSHLTNPDINALNEESDAPVVFVNLGEYKKWLREQGHDDVALFDKVRDLVTITAISVRERMRTRTNNITAPTNGCYELMGFDCFISADLKPYLLECNLSPDLKVCSGPEDGGDIEYEVKNQVVVDMVSLLGLNLPPEDIQSLDLGARADAELARAGQFSRVFPAPDTVEDYLSFFPVPRFADIALAEHILGRQPKPQKLAPSQTSEIISDDELVLYYEKTGTLFKPSELSGWIWLKAAEGVSANNIAEELLAVHTASNSEPSAQEKWQIYSNVWNVLAEWAQIGMLQQADDDNAYKTPDNTPTEHSSTRSVVKTGSRSIELDYGTPILRQTLDPLFIETTTSNTTDAKISLQRTDTGYALAINSKLIASNFGLDEVGEIVSHELFKQAVTSEKEIALSGSWVPFSNNEADFFLSQTGTENDSSLAVLYATRLKKDLSGGAILDLESGALAPIGLPIRIDDASTDKIETLKPLTASGTIQNRRRVGRGRLIASTYQDDGTGFKLRRLYLENQSSNDEGVKSNSEHATHHAALAALIASTIGENGEVPTGAQVQLMNSWLNDIDVQIVSGSDTEATAEFLFNESRD